MTALLTGLLLVTAGRLQSHAQDYKVQVVSLQWGLRVQTDSAGGNVGSFGGRGDFVIDAPSIPGGRLIVKEGGNVGIGIPNPSQKLSVAGMIESTSGGFRFPDGSVQTSAMPTGTNYIQNTTTQQAGANFNIGGNGVVGGTLGIGTVAGSRLAVRGDGTDVLLGSAGCPAPTAGIGFGTMSGCNNFALGGDVSSTSNAGIYLNRPSGQSLHFREGNGSDQMIIVPGGNVGVGIASPDQYSRLQVIAPTDRNAVFASTSGGFSIGVLAVSSGGDGVIGYGSVGVRASSNMPGGTGVRGEALQVNDYDRAVYGVTNYDLETGQYIGYAGYFAGRVYIGGPLQKPGGSFKIDHPLDPANKYLSHSFVESPDMMNIYNGNVTTDERGEASVTLPDYFTALNRDFRYQLTVIGQFAQAIVGSKIDGNRFTIKTDKPQVEVSWQVTGIRQDAWANAHRIPVEEDKPDKERGSYLHPEVHGQPEELGVEWARQPDEMRQMKERRERAKRTPQ